MPDPDNAVWFSALPPSFHHTAMRAALQAANHCREIEWYGVGCVIVDSAGNEIASGHTGELLDASGAFRHAEDAAIVKAEAAGVDFRSGPYLLYSTLEPCSLRASGKEPCVKRIISVGISAVVYGAKEPYEPSLKIVCEGDAQLRAAGITVLWLKEFENECLASVVSKRRSVT